MRNLNYRTIRYPGHAAIMKALLNDLRPARPPRRAQGHPRARGADDAAGRGHRLRHRQRPQERPAAAGDLRQQDLQPATSTAARCSAIQITTAAAICAVLDLLAERRAAGKRASSARRTSRSTVFLANRFGRVYAKPETGPHQRLARLGDGQRCPAERTSVRDEALAILVPARACRTSAFARRRTCRRRRRSPARSSPTSRDRRPAGGRAPRSAGRATAFEAWRTVPAPRRGELVRLLGEELRAAKDDLGRLVTLEAGKIVSEGLGEVQEMIDICDFAVGLSRQLYGLHHRHRARRPPDDGDLASARRLRRHLRLQLPGRGVVVERGARPRLRRPAWSGSRRRRRR